MSIEIRGLSELAKPSIAAARWDESVYRTPCEQAWFDLCDCKDNPEVERVMASIGGWGAWAEVELPYLAFVGAFNGEPEHAARVLARAAAKAGGA